MESVRITELEANFRKLVSRAAGGETIGIARREKLVVRLVPEPRQLKKVDLAQLRAGVEGQPLQKESAGDFMRKLRDSDRY